jgi:hypothetical protein
LIKTIVVSDFGQILIIRHVLANCSPFDCGKSGSGTYW